MKSIPDRGGKPNILWICTDSQRWDTLGCYGNPFVHSPNIDRLAREGVLFENAFTQSPLCTPSRGSFLTGRYPVTNRLRQNGQTVPPDLRPITRALADAEYLCGLSGKLHLSACDQRTSFGPEWWKVPHKYWDIPYEQRVDDGYVVFHWSHSPGQHSPCSAYTQWLISKGAKPGGEDEASPHGEPLMRPRPDELHLTTFCTEKAVEFIEAAKACETWNPWLFSVNIFDPHPSYRPLDEYLAPYLERLDEIPLPSWVEGELDSKPGYHKKSYDSGKLSTKGMTQRQLRLIKAAYWAMCDHIDANVGKLLAALERTGQRDSTLIIFTSDHGEMLGDHGKMIKGPYLFDGAIRVPLIFSWPGRIPQNVRSGALVELTDIAPAILDAAGLPADPAMQGRPLWPMLTGNAPLDRFRDDVYCEYYNANPDKKWLTMVRTSRHKIIAVHGSDEGELYDLQNDPGENRNLWNDPAAKDTKIEMLQRLATRMAYTADPMPARIGVF
ncbi:MAG: sulfatase-like hydrolase/transferase [Planctomycetes bacterium]|nr:sulfatase-like hydrolase/transferase [Planctomycetota bacterium]